MVRHGHGAPSSEEWRSWPFWQRCWNRGLRVGLVIDSSFLNGEQLGAGVAELVAERDGLLEGDGDPAGFPDDDGVEGGVGRRGHRHELFELVSSPGWIGVYCRDGDLVGGAVFAAGGFLVFFWNEAVARSWRVLDVDGSLGHGAEVQEVESGGEPPAPASSPFAVCQSLGGSHP